MAVFDNLNMTTSPELRPEVVEYHTKRLLENIMPAMVHARDMQIVPLPANNGRRAQFRKPVPLDVRTTPLSEGKTPDGQKLKMTELWVTIKPYGGHMEYTDEIDWALLDKNTTVMGDQLADQAKLTLDTLARDAMHSGLNVQYAGGKKDRTSLTAADKLTYEEVKKAVRQLQRKNAKKFADGFYHAVVDPDTEFDLTSDSMWVDVAKYQDKRKVETGELGCMAGVKFFSTTNAKTFTAQTYLYGTTSSLNTKANGYNAATRQLAVSDSLSDDDCRALIGQLVRLHASENYEDAFIENATTDGIVTLRWAPSSTMQSALASAATMEPTGGASDGSVVHSTVIYGQDFAGGVALDGTGHNISMIIKPLGSSGGADPLNQRGTVGWKARGVGYSIIQEDYGIRIEHGVSA